MDYYFIPIPLFKNRHCWLLNLHKTVGEQGQSNLFPIYLTLAGARVVLREELVYRALAGTIKYFWDKNYPTSFETILIARSIPIIK